MSSKIIQVQLLTGPAAGRNFQFSESPVRFGREADNQILLQDELISRYHGELQLEGEQWLLVNKSSNGTKVKGKLVQDKPRSLKGGETVAVGGLKLFQVSLLEGQAAQVLSGDAPEKRSDQLAAEAAAKAAKKKMTLYIGVGVYLFLMFCAAVIFNFSGGGDGKNGGAPLPKEWTKSEIELVIDEIPVRSSNPVQAEDELNKARRIMTQATHKIVGIYEAYSSYRMALALTGRRAFDNANDQLLYDQARKQVVEYIINRYDRAHGLGSTGDYQGGAEICGELLKLYDEENDFRTHIQSLSAVLRQRANAQKR